MNICVYWEQASWGGVDSYLRTLLYHWPNQNHEILVLSNKGNKGLERIQKDLESIPNVRIKKISIWSQAQFLENFDSPGFVIRLFAYALFPFFLLQNFFSILFTLPKQTDVLISQNGAYPGGWSCLVVFLVAKMKRIKMKALVIHHSSTARRIGWYMLEYLLDRMVVAFADKIITVSKASLDSFTHFRKIKLKHGQGNVVYNGVEIPSTNDVKNIFQVEDVKLKIGLVGRCEKRKGHFDILEALILMEPSYRAKLQILFIGHYDVEFKEQVQKFCDKHRITNSVTLYGYSSHTSHEIVDNLDLLCCLTQDYEGFGLTVIEAMAAGTPVLTTDVGALKEFVQNGKNCIVIPPNSPAEISDKLKDFIDQRQKWDALLLNAKTTANVFSAENMANNYYKLLTGN